MKTHHIILNTLLATSIVSCDGNDIIPEIPETPVHPTDSVATEGYQFTFGGSTDIEEEDTRASWTDEITGNDGKRHLVFGWDYTDEKAPTYDMKMAFVSSQGVLTSTESKNYTDVTILKHSTKSDDRHWAEFKTVERYSNPLKEYDGYTLIAVNGKGCKVSTTNPFAMELTMPNTFTQSATNSLTHLSDYMYMYDTYVLKGGDAHLKFKHLTAPVRFRIHNWRSSEAKIYSASMHIANNGALTGSKVSVASDGATYASSHSSITVKAAGDSYFTIAERSQKEYIDLYAHVLPLGSADGIKGKTIQFTIEANDIVSSEKKVQYLTSELDHISAEKFYQATNSYNWKAGDLYTFHIYLDDVAIGSVSIEDWVYNEVL